MKQLYLLAMASILCIGLLQPAQSLADEALEDLEGPMVVADDAIDLNAAIAEMENPDDKDVRDADWNDEPSPVEAPESEEDVAKRRAMDAFLPDEDADDPFDHDNEEEELMEEMQDNQDDGEEVDFDILEPIT